MNGKIRLETPAEGKLSSTLDKIDKILYYLAK